MAEDFEQMQEANEAQLENRKSNAALTPTGWIRRLMCLFVVAQLLILGCSSKSSAGAKEAHERLLDSVPIGSSVSDLRAAPRERRVRSSNVIQWTRAPEEVAGLNEVELRVADYAIQNEFGVFRHKHLGQFAEGYPERALEGDFTGEIVFYIDRGFFEDMAVVRFFFIDGRLVKKRFGFSVG
jgi:hypothetical protein